MSVTPFRSAQGSVKKACMTQHYGTVMAETGAHPFVMWSVKLCMPLMLKGDGHETNYHLNCMVVL